MTYPHGPGPQGPGGPPPGGYDPNQGYHHEPSGAPESGTSYSLEPPGQPGVDPYSAPPAQDPNWAQPDPYAAPHSAQPYSAQPYSAVPQSGQPDPYGQQYGAQPPGYPGAWPQGAPMVPAPKKGMSTGLIAAIAAVSLVVLVIIGGGIGYAVVNSDDKKTNDPVASGSPDPSEKPGEGGDGGAEDLVLEEDDTAEKFFPARFKAFSDYPAYERIAYGKVSCDDATDSTRLRRIFKDLDCKEILVGAYVDEDKEAVVTIGYIRTASENDAKDGSRKIKDYSDDSIRPKLMAPKDSKIDKGYDANYYPSYVDEFITYSLTAWYDGHAPESVDRDLIQHSAAVSVQVQSKGQRD